MVQFCVTFTNFKAWISAYSVCENMKKFTKFKGILTNDISFES